MQLEEPPREVLHQGPSPLDDWPKYYRNGKADAATSVAIRMRGDVGLKTNFGVGGTDVTYEITSVARR